MSMLPKFDVLAIGSHPDDVEICAGGTIASLTAAGNRVGIVDLTRGELSSRGTLKGREAEAKRAAEILNVDRRANLGIADGNIRNSKKNRLKVIQELRATRPDILLIPAPDCRHPDHPAGARLVAEAVFQSGLVKIETMDANGMAQEPWRPSHVLHYMQSIPFEPTLVVDVTDFWAQRTESVKAFSSQFQLEGVPSGENEPETFISNPAFMEWYEARARTYGFRIGATFGEPFLYRHGPIGTDDLVGMLRKEKPFR